MTNNTKYSELAEIVSEQYGSISGMYNNDIDDVLEYAKATAIVNDDTEPEAIIQYCNTLISDYEECYETDEVFYKTINEIIACMPEDEKYLKMTRALREARDQIMREELFPLAM